MLRVSEYFAYFIIGLFFIQLFFAAREVPTETGWTLFGILFLFGAGLYIHKKIGEQIQKLKKPLPLDSRTFYTDAKLKGGIPIIVEVTYMIEATAAFRENMARVHKRAQIAVVQICPTISASTDWLERKKILTEEINRVMAPVLDELGIQVLELYVLSAAETKPPAQDFPDDVF